MYLIPPLKGALDPWTLEISFINSNQFVMEKMSFDEQGKLAESWNRRPWNWVSAQRSEETRIMGIPDGGKSFKMDLAVLMQYRRVTDRHPATQPRRRMKYALCISASRSKNEIRYSLRRTF